MTVARTPLLSLSLMIAAAGLAASLVAPGLAEACSPPLSGWFFIDTVPADGDVDAPINGVVAVRVAFSDPSDALRFPSEDEIERSVRLTLTRDGDEIIPGDLEVDQELGELRFVAARPLAEGITFTLRVELLNSALNLEGDSINEDRSISFTTGDRFDEAPPAFSGLQSVELTQHALPVKDCCPAPEEFCVSMCSSPCDWCWTVDFDYAPQADLTFRAVDDEFGPRSISYLIYKLDSPDAEPTGPPIVRRFDAPGAQTLHLTFPLDAPGPFCFLARAVDIYGRRDGNDSVLCRTLDELRPIAAVEVPEPDRSQCAETPDLDAGMEPDADDQPDASDPDSGVVGEPDASVDPDEPDDEDAPVVNAPGAGQCGCTTPTTRRGAPIGALAALLGLALTLARRRQA